MTIAKQFWTIVPAGNGIEYSGYPSGNPPVPTWTQIPNFLNQTASLSVNIQTTYLTPSSGCTVTLNGTLPTGWTFDGTTLTYNGTSVAGPNSISFTAIYLGFGSTSNSFTVKGLGTPSSDIYAPTIPTGFRATAVTVNSVSLAWNPSSDPSPAGIARSGLANYEITRTPPGSVIATVTPVAANNPVLTLADLGSPSPVSTFAQTGADVTLTTYGNSFSDTSDELAFGYQQITGTTWIATCKISNFTSAAQFSKSGLMVRKSLALNSACETISTYPFAQGNGISWTGATADGTGRSTPTTVLNSASPVWLSLIRSGDTYTGQYSFDGNTFTQLFNISAVFGNTVFVGPFLFSSTNGTQVSCIFEQVNIQDTSVVTTYTDSTVSASTSYTYTITAADSVPNTSSASTSVNATTLATVWIAPTPSYVSQIPNAAGFGMDSVFGSGRHLVTPATTVYLVNTLDASKPGPAAVSVGTRVFTCCMARALASAGPKVIIPIISGVWDVQTTYNNQTSQYCTFAGQVAPSPGFIGINGLVNNSGSDSLWWHWANYLNPATFAQADDLGDCIALGGYSTGSGSRNVAANCSFYGATDETIQLYCIGSDYTVWQCHIGNPTSISGRTRTTAHGTGIIVADDTNNVSIIRSIVQHCNFRMPLTRSRSMTVANCLFYDAGPTPTSGATKYGIWTEILAAGAGNQSLQSPGTVFQSFHNFEQNLYVMGPSPAAGEVANFPIWLNDGGASGGIFPAGSQLYLSGNRKRDRNPTQGQGTNLFSSGNTSSPQTLLVSEFATLPSGYYAGSRITSAYPSGYNVYTITDSEVGKLDFATLLSNTVGSRPLDRSGWDTFSPYQAKNYINGLTGNINIGRVIDGTGTVTASIYGGYPSLASNLVDVFNSTAMSGDPLITVEAGRDAVQASGLTWLEEWLQRWHLRRATY